MPDRVNPYLGIRSVIESPILDEHKWSKVPTIAADAVFLDMEDSVAPERKLEARAKVIQVLREPGLLADRVLIPRVNALDTPWGRDDLAALAAAGVPVLAYPKVGSRAELDEVRSVLAAHGSAADLFLVIESARAVVDLQQLACAPGVVGLMFGPSDLAVDAGSSLFDGDEVFEASVHYPRSKVALTGAAYGLARINGMAVVDLRDSDAVRACADLSRRLGFTGVMTFYPPHVEVINDVYIPSDGAVAAAAAVVREYEAALEQGEAATSRNGRALIVQDYKLAKQLLTQRNTYKGDS